VATDYASVIRPLQVVVLAVAGLFLVRVMRVAMVEVRPPRTEPGRSARQSKRRESRRMGLEFIEPSGLSGERVRVDGAVVIGRAPSCDVTVEDEYLSSRHAQFSIDEGDLLIEDLDSTNGTYVNQELIAHRTRLERGDIVQVGGVIFEVVR
jgi:pSer/pThr/pTyr-binding forkhead associated (FHA) protein